MNCCLNPDCDGECRVLAGAACVADEMEAIVRHWKSWLPGGGQHVGVRPNLTPSWIKKFEEWAGYLRGKL